MLSIISSNGKRIIRHNGSPIGEAVQADDGEWVAFIDGNGFMRSWLLKDIAELLEELRMLNSKAATPQPHPTTGELTVLDYVLADLQERSNAGIQKYGTPLQTHNGRDALWDAYQEALDLCMYLRQAILERDGNG